MIVEAGASRQGAERAGECDGPTSPPRRQPVATWPQSRAHGPARVPPVRSSMRFVPYKGPRGGPPPLPSAPAPRWARRRPSEPWRTSPSPTPGPLPPDGGDAGEGQGRFTPFLDFPPMLRRVVYTTNAIESASDQLRKVTKNRSHYSPPTRPQLNYCGWRSATSRTNAPESATRTRANSPANAPPRPVSSKANSPPTAKQALTQLTTAYPDRITPYL